MEVITNLTQVNKSLFGCAMALGTFDGVHLGHRTVINAARNYAHQHNRPAAVFSFANRPLDFILPRQNTEALADNQNKLKLLADLGVDALLHIRFDEQIVNITAEDFMNILVKYFRPAALFVGDNFTYGKAGAGNTQTLRAECARRSIDLEVLPLLSIDGTIVSSTNIRQAVKSGQMELAAKLLGRWYRMEGTVVHGAAIGRTIGFPTANIELLDIPLALPPTGGYIVSVEYAGHIYPGIANIGINPTVKTAVHPRLEVHILDFAQDIYNHRIQVDFHKYLGPEQRFAGLTELKNYIAEVSALARAYFKNK